MKNLLILSILIFSSLISMGQSLYEEILPDNYANGDYPIFSIVSDRAFADFDGDGDVDMFRAGSYYEGIYFTKAFRMAINDGSGKMLERDVQELDIYKNTTTTEYPDNSFKILAGDFNGDGSIDLVLAGAVISIYTNSGDATFTLSDTTQMPTYSATEGFNTRVSAAVAGDFDKDGDLDIIIAFTGSSDYTFLFFNEGDGHFDVANSNPISLIFPRMENCGLYVNDFDDDKDLDLLITGNSNYSIFYENNGAGMFSLYDTISSDVALRNVKFFDFDGDSDIDILGAFGDEIYLFEKKADLSYKNIVSPFPNKYSVCITNGDYDNDGDIDILLNSGGTFGDSDGALLYANDGEGNFQQVDNSFLPLSGYMGFQDFNNDGYLDVFAEGLAYYYNSLENRFYINHNGAYFTEFKKATFDLFDIKYVSIADVDGDKDNDILVYGVDYTDRTRLYKNDGLGNYTLFDSTRLGQVSTFKPHFVDLDSDGDLDLIAGNGKSKGFDLGTHYEAQVYFNDGFGNYIQFYNPSDTLWLNFGDPDNNIRSISHADIDNDGDIDFVCYQRHYNNIIIVENINNGEDFVVKSTLPDIEDGIVRLSDIDGDNDVDLIYGSKNRRKILYHINDGEGNFTNSTTTIDYYYSTFFDFDADGDGDPDILSVEEEWNPKIELFLNEGNGVFTKTLRNYYNRVCKIRNISDLDNDGDLDIIYSLKDSTEVIHLLLNDGNGNFDYHLETKIIFDRIVSIEFADMNGDGRVDLIANASKYAWDKPRVYFYNSLLTQDVTKVTNTENNLSFEMFPNPSTDYLTINIGKQSGDFTVEIYSLEGKLVLQKNVQTGVNTNINLEGIKTGLYLIKVVSENNEQVQRLVKL